MGVKDSTQRMGARPFPGLYRQPELVLSKASITIAGGMSYGSITAIGSVNEMRVHKMTIDDAHLDLLVR